MKSSRTMCHEIWSDQKILHCYCKHTTKKLLHHSCLIPIEARTCFLSKLYHTDQGYNHKFRLQYPLRKKYSNISVKIQRYTRKDKFNASLQSMWNTGWQSSVEKLPLKTILCWNQVLALNGTILLILKRLRRSKVVSS